MRHTVLILALAAVAASAGAQSSTPAPTPSTSKSSTPAAKASAAAPASTAEPMPWIKLPPGVPRVVHGPVKMPVALRYEDVKVGTGAEGESGKMWHLKYTGWRAADGVKFDSWDEHKMPVMGKDGKPQLGSDGKPVMGDPKPLEIPQGVGRVIPGFDYGLAGMKVGGKRRIFIPWEMAYGTHAIPDRPDHPGIPAKSDLIFDVELVEVTDMPQPPPRPAMPPRPGMPPAGSHPPGAPGAPGQPAAPGTAPGAAQPAKPGAAAAPATPPASTAPPSSQPATQPAAPAQPSTPPQSQPQQPQQK